MNPFRRRQFIAMQQGGGAVAFTPASIAGLKLWLDASQIVGLNDGDPVAAMTDYSVSSGNLAQGTASKRPTFKTAIQNGLPVVRFDGVDDTLGNSSWTALDGLTGATQFAVAKQFNGGSGGVFFFSSGRLTLQQYIDDRYYYQSAGNSGRVATASGQWIVDCVVFDGSQVGNAARLVAFQNAVQQTLIFTGTIGASLGTSTGYQLSGVDAVPYAPQQTDFAELLIYNRVLTSQERAKVLDYLNAKWAIY
jgi:hypothetical protein